MTRILSFILLAVSSCLHSQTWLQKASIPFDVQNSEGTSFGVGDKIYIVCGVINNQYSTFCWEYNTTLDVWSQKASCPKCPPRFPSSFVINGLGYVFGGFDTCVGATNDLWEFNPASDSWLQKASLPDTVRSGAVGFSINNLGYIVGGAFIFGVVTNDCWEYNSSTDSWNAKASMPCTGRVFGSGFAINSKGYVGLGTTYAQNLNDWWEYDPLNDSWQIRDSLPGNSQVSECSSFSIGNYGYVGPGPYDFIIQYSFFRYDAVNDQWTQLPNFPGSQYWSCYSASALGKGYIISGYDGSSTNETTWEFTPPVGIEEFDTHHISAFPIPANEEIVFSSTAFTHELNILILSLTGQVVQEHVIHALNNRFTLSRNGLKPGYYFLEVSDDQGRTSRIKFAFL